MSLGNFACVTTPQACDQHVYTRTGPRTPVSCGTPDVGKAKSANLPLAPEPRFLTLDQVAEELPTSRAQIYALVRRSDLAAIKLNDREQWRVERSALEEYLDRARAETAAWIAAHPFTGRKDEDSENAGAIEGTWK